MKITEIVRIKSVEPIDNADRIEKIIVKGWTCVSRKGLYKEDDLACFVYPDTLIPKKFLDGGDDEEPIKLKTIKMKGVFSAGLLIPMSELPENEYKEGDDVSEVLNIKKYEKILPASLAGDAVGNFPTIYISKTDEDNIRSMPEIVDELKYNNYSGNIVGSLKYDGTSSTFIIEGDKIKTCSRNLELKESEKSTYWQIARKYNLLEKLKNHNFAIQGEICGLGVNKNQLKLNDVQLFIFHVKNLDSGNILDWGKMQNFCDEFDLPTVHKLINIDVNDFINQFKSGELQKWVNTVKYPQGNPAEGVVFKTEQVFPSVAMQKPWWSGKIINENYKD